MTIQTVKYSPNSSNPTSFPTKQNKNNGITSAKGGMPGKFRGADGGASFAMGRNIYVNTPKQSTLALKTQYDNLKVTMPWGVPGKPISIQSSDQYIQRKKNLAIGRGSMPGYINGQSSDLSFKSTKNSNFNTSYDARRRCRSGGCVAPAKKGARSVCK